MVKELKLKLVWKTLVKNTVQVLKNEVDPYVETR